MVGRLFVVREDTEHAGFLSGLDSLRDRVVDALRSRAAIFVNTWSASGFVRLGILGRVRGTQRSAPARDAPAPQADPGAAARLDKELANQPGRQEGTRHLEPYQLR